MADGTYDIVGGVLRTVSAPGVQRGEVLAFRDIAQSFADGDVSSDQAAAVAAGLSTGFAELWRWMNANNGTLSVVLAILSVYLTIHSMGSDDLSDEQRHNDAVIQRQATEKTTQAVENLTLMQQRIYEALRDQKLPARGVSDLPPVPSIAPPRTPMQLAGRPNRNERRAAATKARRQRKGLSGLRS